VLLSATWLATNTACSESSPERDHTRVEDGELTHLPFSIRGTLLDGDTTSTLFEADTNPLDTCRVRELDRLGAEGWALVSDRSMLFGKRKDSGYTMTLMRELQDTQADS
jgi:hypothetical protein